MAIATLLFSPKGRIAQQTFWLGAAICSAISIIALFVPKIGNLLWLASWFPWIMITIKRLHDMGKSGWVMLIAPVANLLIVIAATVLLGRAVFVTLLQKDIVQSTLDMGAAAGVGGMFLLSGGLLLFNTIWLIWIGGTPGTPDVNRYGRPPHWPAAS